MLLYKFAAKQPKKNEPVVKIFFMKWTTTRDEPVKSTVTSQGMKMQEYPDTENCGKERLEDYSKSDA